MFNSMHCRPLHFWRSRRGIFGLRLVRSRTPFIIADWRAINRVGCVSQHAQAMPFVKALPGNVCDRSMKRKPFWKLAFGFIKQSCANALALRFRRDKKLIKHIVMGDCCKKSGNAPIDNRHLQVPTPCKTAHDPVHQAVRAIKGWRSPIHFTGAGVPNRCDVFIFSRLGRSYLHEVHVRGGRLSHQPQPLQTPLGLA